MILNNLELPHLFNERYELTELIGSGGMGSVFKAFDRTLGKEIAIKILNSDFADSQMVRFQQEAKVIAKLAHQNILTIYDFAQSTEEQLYLSMELINGKSLETVLNERGRMPVNEALEIALQLLKGLEHAHENEILHRDIKPSNVMLVHSGNQRVQVKLVDFGLAKINLEDQKLTDTGMVIGSPLYMSPEQSSGSNIDNRSDIYSFGCLLFKLLTGEVPFRGEDALKTFAMRQLETAPSLASVAADLEFSQELEEIVATCLATECGDRYSSVGEVYHSLEEEQERLNTDFREASVSESPKHDVKGNQSITIVATILVLGVVSLVLLFPFLSNLNPSESNESKTEEELTDHRFTNVFSGMDAEVNASNIEIKSVSDTINGKVIYLNVVDYESVTLDVSAYKKLIEFSQTRPISKLKLDGCFLDDDAMNYISQIKGVEELRISVNEGISPEGFEHLAKLPNLKKLYASEMGLKDGHIEAICKIKSLNILEVPLNPDLTDSIFPSLDTLPALLSLVVGSPKISLSKLTQFVNSKPNISHLGIRVFPANDRGAENLASIKYVVRLDLQRCHFTNPKKVVDYISKLKSVMYLELNFTEAKGSDVQALNSCPNITNLSMDHCKLNDSDLSQLAKLKYIKQLSFKSNSDISIKGVKAIARNKNIIGVYSPDLENGEERGVQFWGRVELDKLLARNN